MAKHIKCVKSKISRKISSKKLQKQNHLKHPYHHKTNSANSSKRNSSANSNVLEFENFQSKLNLIPNQQKLNMSRVVTEVKKKVLKLLQLEDCFEEEEFLYGFRSKVTLIEDQPCILVSTCKGSPQDLNSNLKSNSEFPLNQDYKDYDHYTDLKDYNGYQDYQDYQDYKDYKDYQDLYDRQTGEGFSSDGPPNCRVSQTDQC